jgi:hypothetical protein
MGYRLDGQGSFPDNVCIIYLGEVRPGREVRMAHTVQALLSTIIQNNISPLCTWYGQCACLTVEGILPHRMLLIGEYMLCHPIA